MINKQPICDNPINGCMSTGSGYRLCCNPAHNSDPKNYGWGCFSPVWHKQSEWPAAFDQYGVTIREGLGG